MLTLMHPSVHANFCQGVELRGVRVIMAHFFFTVTCLLMEMSQMEVLKLKATIHWKNKMRFINITFVQKKQYKTM